VFLKQTNEIVVVEITTDDCRTKVNDHTTNVDHHQSKGNTADTPPTHRPRVELTEGVRFAADDRDEVESRRSDDDDVGATEGGAQRGWNVTKESCGKWKAVEALDEIKHTRVYEECTCHTS